MEWEKIHDDLKIKIWIVLFILSSSGYIFLPPKQTLSIIIGGLIVIVNFKFFEDTLKKAFGNNLLLVSKKTAVFIKIYFRLFAMGLIIALLLKFEMVNPVGLTIGLSTIVLAIGLFAVCLALKSKSREAS
jgi:hypothetical protein